MEKKCGIIVENIQGIDPKKLQKVIIEDSNKRRWAIKDSLNNTTPFFKNECRIITKPQYDNFCLFVGEKDGVRSIYYATPSSERQSCNYGKADFDKKINRIHNLERDDQNILVYLQGTQGEEVCLFNVDKLKKSSDTFDSLYVGKGVPNKSHVFMKMVELYGEKRMYVGMVNEDGKIGPFIFDVFHKKHQTTPIITTEDGYDLLDVKTIKEELSKEIKPYSFNIEKNDLESLIKLNTVSPRKEIQK